MAHDHIKTCTCTHFPRYSETPGTYIYIYIYFIYYNFYIGSAHRSCQSQVFHFAELRRRVHACHAWPPHFAHPRGELDFCKEISRAPKGYQHTKVRTGASEVLRHPTFLFNSELDHRNWDPRNRPSMIQKCFPKTDKTVEKSIGQHPKHVHFTITLQHLSTYCRIKTVWEPMLMTTQHV